MKYNLLKTVTLLAAVLSLAACKKDHDTPPAQSEIVTIGNVLDSSVLLSLIGRIIVATVILTTLALTTRAQNKKNRSERKEDKR
ncbi:hypothetical protein A4D02_28615 [Niastella koreensis]|uniref:Lipoprotein n=1 Tax=Niastella koreensis TaxID=354356 RepID=A0ABX3NY12_9BACT|nr:hypothetical protein [Niastella koreensis]OQP49558.1 hypothetical protein A4D02_28615 [Niastella koreensis]